MKNSNSSNPHHGARRNDDAKGNSDFRVDSNERRTVGGHEFARENAKERSQPTQDIRSVKRNSMADES